MQRPGRLAGREDTFFTQQNIAGIETRIHPHHGDPALLVTGQDSGMHRCRAAVTREKGSVEIQGAE